MDVMLLFNSHFAGFLGKTIGDSSTKTTHTKTFAKETLTGYYALGAKTETAHMIPKC